MRVTGIMLAVVLAWGTARAEIEIVVADRLVRVAGDLRQAQRDSTGQLIALPGDELEYTLTATNQGSYPAVGVELVDAIPHGVTYVLDSAAGSGLQVWCSADQGESYARPPLVQEVRQEDGTVIEQHRPASAYTHVKWVAPEALAPGEVLVATFRVRVNRSAPGDE